MKEYLPVAIGSIVVLLIFLLFVLRKKSAVRAEKMKIAEDKRRERALDEMLHNELGAVKNRQGSPYEVDYTENGRQGAGAAASRIMLEIVEKCELSVRKYMLDPAEGIWFGSAPEGNHIVVRDPDIKARECVLFVNGSDVLIQDDFATNITVLRRKKKETFIGKAPVVVQNRDVLVLGKYEYQIHIVK